MDTDNKVVDTILCTHTMCRHSRAEHEDTISAKCMVSNCLCKCFITLELDTLQKYQLAMVKVKAIYMETGWANPGVMEELAEQAYYLMVDVWSELTVNKGLL